MTRTTLRGLSLGLLSGVALLAAGLTFGDPAFAQSQRSSGGGQDSGGGHETIEQEPGGQGGRGGSGAGRGEGRGQGAGQSVRDVFENLEESERGSSEDASRGQRGGDDTARGGRPADAGGRGKPGDLEAAEEEDSDRPAWAGVPGPGAKPGRGGSTESGTKKGDLYGDLYIIVRDENGVPVLDEDGYVQVLYYDANGTLTCCILRDEEGNLLPTLADGTAVVAIEVELGRLSVGRSPDAVLAAQYEEAIDSINTAASVTLDASGRIVLTYSDGTTKTIDSPLENLALYVELLSTGTLAGVDAASLGTLSYLVDGTLTAEDLAVAASLFAAASDKTVSITTDAIVYMNSIVGIDGALEGDYVDYTSYTYDREDVYGDMTLEALVQQDDGSWVVETVNVYDAVFNSVPTEVDGVDLTNIAAFTTAADDARLVIEYLHQFAPPEVETTTSAAQ